ncbi:ABC transporter permease [Desulfitobacterium dehalogenans]|uniref:ABC transporter permease n=1 Tax=Desulfitobacterium dehalogenans TaxID=36854 RepID=UPI001FA743F6|nr:ABC transporter permease [Desulfitobacterium dehalogenans]
MKYIAIWSILTALLLFIFIYNTWLVFENETDLHWKSMRLFTISGFMSLTIIIIVSAIYKWKAITPYLAKLFKYQPLLYQLVRRDFKAKYKRSVLGILWTILNPLFTMIILTIVFSTLFRFDIENYPVYLLSGQIVFSFFSESTNMAMTSVLNGASMIKKVNMPKYIFPLSRLLSSLVNFTLSLVALILVMVLTQSSFHLTMLLMIVPIIYIFIFSLGVGLILSAAVVFFRDMMYLYGILITALTYLTPIFYPISIIPEHFRLVISLNPMYHFVEYFRTVSIYGGMPTIWQNIVCLTLAFVSVAVGLFVFYKKQDQFILHI